MEHELNRYCKVFLKAYNYRHYILQTDARLLQLCMWKTSFKKTLGSFTRVNKYFTVLTLLMSDRCSTCSRICSVSWRRRGWIFSILQKTARPVPLKEKYLPELWRPHFTRALWSQGVFAVRTELCPKKTNLRALLAVLINQIADKLILVTF